MKTEVRLCCENCHTIFAIRVSEVSFGDNRSCPACGETVAIDGDAVRRAARKIQAHLDLGRSPGEERRGDG